jgi:hypothetical protein
LNDLKDKQIGAGVSDEEFQRLEAEKVNLQSTLTLLIEERESQKVYFSFRIS